MESWHGSICGVDPDVILCGLRAIAPAPSQRRPLHLFAGTPNAHGLATIVSGTAAGVRAGIAAVGAVASGSAGISAMAAAAAAEGAAGSLMDRGTHV